MIIGQMVINLFSDRFHSLKEKRQVVLSLKERLKKKFNIALVESDFQETWQKTQISLVSISASKALLEKMFRQIENFIFDNYGLQILDVQIHYF